MPFSAAEQPLASRLCTEVGWEDPELETCFSAEDAEDEIERIANVRMKRNISFYLDQPYLKITGIFPAGIVSATRNGLTIYPPVSC